MRARRSVSLLRSALTACVVLAGAFACSGIITGPDAGPDTRPRSMRIAPATLTLARGDTARFAATLYDVTGTPTQPESDVPLTYRSDDTTIARIDATGLVTGVAGGTTTVRGLYGALTLGAPVTVTVRPRLVVVSGDAQAGEQGDTLAQPLVVRALDAAGQPVAGDTVRFIVLGGGGTVTPDRVVTGVDGLAATRWTLGLDLGAQAVRAERTGSDSAEFAASARAGTRARRVAITAARTTLAPAGDTATLVARAYNVVDSLLAGAAFTWQSSDTTVATVSPAGVVTSRLPGTTVIRAASDAAADSVTIIVMAAATGVRHWIGAVSDAWSLGANWREGTPPEPSDSVVIPASDVVTMPRIPTGAIRALVSLSAGTFDIDGDGALRVADALVLRTDVLAARCDVGGGFLLETPTTDGPHPLAGRVACDVSLEDGARLLVDSLVLEGRSLGLTGTARLTLAGHPVRLDGQQLFVQGGSRLEMHDPADRVHALFASISTSESAMFTAGALHLRHGLSVSGAGAGFTAGGSHRVVLESSVPGDTATVLVAAGVRFRHLDVNLPTRVDGTFALDGDLVMGATGALVGVATPTFGLPERLQVLGDITAADGATTRLRLVELGGALVAPSFAPDTVAFIGTGQEVPFDGTVDGLTHVRVSGQATARVLPSQRRFLPGDLVIDGDFGISETFAAAIGVSGDLRVVGGGILRLGGSYASIRVEGNALFDGRAMNGELASGDLELGGDLVQRASTSPRSLRPAAGFEVYLIGGGVIDFATPDSSRLAGLQHWGNFTRTLRSDLNVDGRVRYDLNNVTYASDQLGAGGTRRLTARGIILSGTTFRNVAVRLVDGAPIDLRGGLTFSDFDPAAVQLEVARTAGSATLSFPTFTTTPTGAGSYLLVRDPDGDANGAFTLAVQDPTPATHGGFAVAVAPATITGWAAGEAPPSLQLGDDQQLPASLMELRRITLPAAATAPLTVRLRTVDSTIVQVASVFNGVGALRDSVVIDADSTGASWLLHAIEGRVGASTMVIAEAPGYAPDTMVVAVVQPGFTLRARADTLQPRAPTNPPIVYVTVGRPSADSIVPFPVRFGVAPQFTLRTLAPSVARVIHQDNRTTSGGNQGPADSVTFTINSGSASTSVGNFFGSFAVPASLLLEARGVEGAAPIVASGPTDYAVVRDTLRFTFRDLPAYRIEAVAGEGQVGLVGTPAPIPATAQVRDSLGNPVLGVPVTIRLRNAGVVRDEVVDTTDAAGLVEYAFTFPTRVAETQVEFEAPGLVGSPLTYLQYPAPGPAVGLAFASGMTTGAATRPLVPGWRVRAVDQYGNVDTAYTGVVTVALTNGGAQPATLGGTAARAAVAGEALFDDLTIDVAHEGYVLVASATGLTGASSAPFTITIPVTLRLVGTPLLGLGGTATVRASLSVPAYGSGIPVGLRTADAGIFTVDAPQDVVVPPGDTVTFFTVRGVGTGTSVMRAFVFGTILAGESALTVSANTISVPLALNAPYTRTTSLPITLTQPAPAGGTTLTVATADPSVVGVLTPTVTIPEGTRVGSALLEGLVLGQTSVTVAGSDLASGIAIVRVTAALDIIEGSTSLNAGFSTATVTTRLLSGGSVFAAPPGGIPLTFTSRDPACVATPALTVVPAGANSIAIQAAYGGTAATPCTTRLLVTSPSFDADSLTVTVQPPPGTSLSITPRIAAGLVRQGTLFLGALSPAGGTLVTLSSSDSTRLVLSTESSRVGSGSIQFTIPPGSNAASFWYAGLEDQGGTSAVLSAVVNRYASPTPVAIAIDTLALDGGMTTSLTTLGGDGSGWVNLGSLVGAAGNQSAINETGVRAGGRTYTVTLTSTTPGVALPVVGGTATNGATLTIGPGQSRANFGVRPLSTGTTTFAATALNVVTPVRPSYPPTITVSQPGSSLSVTPRIAAGLVRQGTLFLGALAPAGGTVITLAVSDSTRLVLSRDAATVGTGTLELTVPAGSNAIGFWYAGLEDQGGTSSTLTATFPAGQFASPTPVAIAIDTLALDGGMTTSLTTLGGDGSGWVNLGSLVGAAGNQSAINETAVRAGGRTYAVTITSTAPTVAVPVVGGVAANGPVLSIGPGQSRANFGVRPLVAGTTTFAMAAPNVITPVRPSFPATITISAPGSSLSLNNRLGAGLAMQGTLFLGAPAPTGGVTVTLTSSDSARLLLAPNLITAGAGRITVTVPQGSNAVGFVAMGLEDVTGNPTVTAQTPGYTDATATIAIEPIGVQWNGASSLTTLSGDGSGAAFVGIISGVAGNRSVTPEQVIRFGGVARTITLTSSDPAVMLPVVGGVAQQRITAVIATGQSRVSVGVRPVAPGVATLAPSGAGLVQAESPSLPQSVTVTVPTLSLSTSSRAIGGGLAQAMTLFLQTPVPTGGRQLELTVSDPSRLLVALDASSAGQSSLTIDLGAGNSARSFVVMALEGATGTASVTARIADYRDTTFTFDLVQPGVTLDGPPPTRTVAQGDIAFQATVGVPSGAGVLAQPVRAGAPAALTVTLVSSAPSVGTLVVGGEVGATRTVSIAVGQSASSAAVAERPSFRPLSAGNTTVTATIPGFAQQGNAIRTVTVSP